jgi:glycosyltransferase involved in cell wall biosynthesis
VIGTDVGGIPDIVHHRKTGLLAPPRNPARLSESIRECLNEALNAQQRTERALEMVKAHHTLDAMGHRILSLYSKNLIVPGR